MPPQRGTALGIKAPASSAVSIAALLARRRRLTPVSRDRRDPRRETKCALALRTPVAPFARWRHVARVARQAWETTQPARSDGRAARQRNLDCFHFARQRARPDDGAGLHARACW